MKYTNPLDYLLTTTVESKLQSLKEEVDPLFGEDDSSEVTLPDEDFSNPEDSDSEFPGEDNLDELPPEEEEPSKEEVKKKIDEIRSDVEALRDSYTPEEYDEVMRHLDDISATLDSINPSDSELLEPSEVPPVSDELEPTMPTENDITPLSEEPGTV